MQTKQQPNRPTKGFARAGSLVSRQIRAAGEQRGFAESRLLTQWVEIAGPDVARICRPVKVSHSRGVLGATLVLLTTGAQAPMLQAQLPKLREKVNACYGYAAIAQIKITQTASTGFSEGRAQFGAAPATAAAKSTPPQISAQAKRAAAAVEDDKLKAALERLSQNILTRHESNKG